MTPPRRAPGPRAPGRVAAVMLRALTAELSDPGRYARAKAYARDDAVTDIDVMPGAVRAVVQGSRREPYVATVYVDAGDADELAGHGSGTALAATTTALLIPSRADVAATCTCPDGGAGALVVCKHALAALLVFADELAVEPDLLRRWRAPGDDPHPDGGAHDGTGDGGHGDAGRRVRPRSVAPVDVLAERLRARGPLPVIGPVSALTVRPAPDDDVAELLAMARSLLMAPADRR